MSGAAGKVDAVWMNRGRREWSHDEKPAMIVADLRELALRLP